MGRHLHLGAQVFLAQRALGAQWLNGRLGLNGPQPGRLVVGEEHKARFSF